MASFKRTSSGGLGNNQDFAYVTGTQDGSVSSANWGAGASRSMYSPFTKLSTSNDHTRDLLNSRLWHGVPQLTEEQMGMFEAAHQGHTFIFVVGMPKFMTTGIYANTLMHQQARNLKSVIERASTAFTGPADISATEGTMDDGDEKKVSHIVSVTKAQNDISLTLHEFAGQPVKNGLETWLTGVFDYRSQHGNYFGNLNIPGGWCLANHTMSILVVQVDPSWTVVQDAAYYYNMWPTDVPFDSFTWDKGNHSIIDSLNITFKCNEERSPMITYAAERYMNNRVLSMVATSVYNSRQFVVNDFAHRDTNTMYELEGFKQNINTDTTTGSFIGDSVEYDETLSYGDIENISHEKGSALEYHETYASDPTLTHKYYSGGDKAVPVSGIQSSQGV